MPIREDIKLTNADEKWENAIQRICCAVHIILLDLGFLNCFWTVWVSNSTISVFGCWELHIVHYSISISWINEFQIEEKTYACDCMDAWNTPHFLCSGHRQCSWMFSFQIGFDARSRHFHFIYLECNSETSLSMPLMSPATNLNCTEYDENSDPIANHFANRCWIVSLRLWWALYQKRIS